jgi:hypothetical protein
MIEHLGLCLALRWPFQWDPSTPWSEYLGQVQSHVMALNNIVLQIKTYATIHKVTASFKTLAKQAPPQEQEGIQRNLREIQQGLTQKVGAQERCRLWPSAGQEPGIVSMLTAWFPPAVCCGASLTHALSIIWTQGLAYLLIC